MSEGAYEIYEELNDRARFYNSRSKKAIAVESIVKGVVTFEIQQYLGGGKLDFLGAYSMKTWAFCEKLHQTGYKAK